MKVVNAVERLRLHPTMLRDRFLSRPVDCATELVTFLRTAEQLARDTRKERVIDAREITDLRRHCQSSNYAMSEFNKREIRILCRDEVTVLAPQFLSNLTEAVRTGALHIRIEPLITIYFNRWGSISNQQMLESLH